MFIFIVSLFLCVSGSHKVMDGFSSVYEHSAGNEQILMILCRLCIAPRAAKCGLWTSCSHEDQQ